MAMSASEFNRRLREAQRMAEREINAQARRPSTITTDSPDSTIAARSTASTAKPRRSSTTITGAWTSTTEMLRDTTSRSWPRSTAAWPQHRARRQSAISL